jgi:5'-nucleotidase
VYHSGTVGACLTARNGGWNGVAVSQAVTGWGIEGQAWDEMLVGQQWDTAAEVASVYVGGLVAAGLPGEPVVANINVPNVATADLLGWRRTSIDAKPIRGMSSATLDPIEGQEGSFKVAFDYGEAAELPPDSDGGAVEAGFVSVSYISRLTALDRDDLGGAEAALASLVGG